MTKRSDQQIALGRRPTWICRIGRLCIAAEVPENPFDDGRILNARDHLKLPAAAPADLNVDSGKRSDAESRKDTFEALRPGQGPLPVGGRRLTGLHRLAGSRRGFLPAPGAVEKPTAGEAADTRVADSAAASQKLAEAAPVHATVATGENVPLVLTAILYDEKGEGSIAIIAAGDGDEQVYRTGQQIAGTADTHLQAIYTDRAVVNRRGLLETLRLTEGGYSQAPPGTFAYQQGFPRLVKLPTGASSGHSLGDPAGATIARLSTAPTVADSGSPQPGNGASPVVRIEAPDGADGSPDTPTAGRAGDAEIPRIGQDPAVN